MLFAWAQKKKTHDFINRKGSLDKKNLVEFWAKLPTKTGIGWKNQEILSRTRTGSILRCNSPSDCVEAFDHVCPPVSLGWVVVGGWTKIADRLEGPSPEIFLSVCSSKLEASQAFVQRLQLFSKMSAATSMFFISHVVHSKSGVVDSEGTHLSFWCMHDKCMNMKIYMMNSPFEGWHMIVTLAWWNKNFDSCPNSTSLEFKMLQEEFAPMQINDSTYNLRTSSIHYVNMGRFSTWSQKGLWAAQWPPHVKAV
jgi:hypothetical protein